MLSAENAAAAAVLVSLCGYLIFGGADFGSGVWTALASGPRRRQQRTALFQAIGPVWETNHIWLILVVVALFTNFPIAFAPLFTALLAPLVLALVGITFRGAAFAFRHYGEENATQLPATTAIFAVSSLITPFALGTCVGAVAAGGIRAGLYGRLISGSNAWIEPFSLLCGLIAVVACAFLTASYMTVRVQGELRTDFRNRALGAALALGALTTIAIPFGNARNSFFAHRLANPGPLLLVAGAVALGSATLALLWFRIYRFVPAAAAGTACTVIVAWGGAQYPYLLPPGLRIRDAAGPHETIIAFLIVLPIGLAVLLPSLWLLYRVLALGELDLDGQHGGAGDSPLNPPVV